MNLIARDHQQCQRPDNQFRLGVGNGDPGSIMTMYCD